MDLYRLRKRKMIRYNENLYQKFVLIFITEVEVTKYIKKKKKKYNKKIHDESPTYKYRAQELR